MRQFHERFVMEQGNLRAGTMGMDAEWLREAEFIPVYPTPPKLSFG